MIFISTAAEENVWFYRDRCGTIRGPAHLQTLRQCWVGGVVDEHTMMWGNGLGDWIPARNIRGLIPLIRNPPTIFMSWIVRKFVDTDEKIRALRAQRFSEGLAKSDTLDAEGVSKWDKKRRAELKRQGKVLGSLTSRVIPRVTKSDVRVDFK